MCSSKEDNESEPTCKKKVCNRTIIRQWKMGGCAFSEVKSAGCPLWLSRIKSWYVGLKARKSWCDTNGSHVNMDKIVYTAHSKIEAESWMASVGKRKYPDSKLRVEKMRSKFNVIKKN